MNNIAKSVVVTRLT